MSQPSDSFEHEVRKDRTTYAAALLLAGLVARKDFDMYSDYKALRTRAVDLAIDIEREVSRRLDKEQIINASKK